MAKLQYLLQVVQGVYTDLKNIACMEEESAVIPRSGVPEKRLHVAGVQEFEPPPPQMSRDLHRLASAYGAGSESDILRMRKLAPNEFEEENEETPLARVGKTNVKGTGLICTVPT